MAKLTTIEGIGEVLAETFKAAGVGSCEALLKQGATPEGRQALEEQTGIDAKRILRFVRHADIMSIRLPYHGPLMSGMHGASFSCIVQTCP